MSRATFFGRYGNSPNVSRWRSGWQQSGERRAITAAVHVTAFNLSAAASHSQTCTLTSQRHADRLT
jgi:hypothetical protein